MITYSKSLIRGLARAFFALVFSLIFIPGYAQQTLKTYFADDFVIGVALNQRQVFAPAGADARLEAHFNSLSPENGLKWALVQPRPGEYNFSFGDAYVELGQKMNAFVIGHTLVWHQQVPRWVFQDGEGDVIDAEGLRTRMSEHIATVAGRYQGKIHGWDVVNEAFEENGEWRKSSWYTILGPDFIADAFTFAHEADPEAELYYNDYNVWRSDKREGILEMAKSLQERGIRIDGIGMQGHYGLENPSLDQIEQAILDIHALGLKVMVTELDINVLPNPGPAMGADLNQNFAQDPRWNPYPEGLPDSVYNQLIVRYADIFKLYQKHSDKITRVTFWGMDDSNSWLNNWPIRGRTNYPLLFDRAGLFKEEFWEKMEEN